MSELCSCEIVHLRIVQSFVSMITMLWNKWDWGQEENTEEFRSRGAFKRLIRRPGRRTVNRREL